jgi:hypothetical protein
MNTNTIQNPVPILQQPKSNIVTNPLITGTETKITDAPENHVLQYNNSFSKIKGDNQLLLFGIIIFILGILSSFVFN